jgi:hypothetical protein
MMRATPQTVVKYSIISNLHPINPTAFPTHLFLPYNKIPATTHRHRLSTLSVTAAFPQHHLAVLADYVPKFPRLFDTPIKDFIAPDVPLLPGFNADNVTSLFLPDLINPETIYTLLLIISCAAAVVYLELGALFNDFIQEKDFERLEEQFLRQQELRKSNKSRGRDRSNISSIAQLEEEISVGKPTPEEQAYKERKRGLGWLAFVTAAALWSTGILNKLNAFQP